MGEEPTGTGVTATIKAGKGYEASWLVFRGTPEEVKQQVAETVIGDEDVSALTVAETVHYAAQRFQSIGNLSSKLGAVILPKETAEANTDAPAESGEKPPWNEAAEAPEAKGQESEEDPLIAAIMATSDLTGIQRLWSEQKEAFARPDVQAAVAKQRKILGA